MREYAEDTAFRSLVSSTTTFSARRRTLFLFHTHPEVESPLYLIDNTEDLWHTLNKTLERIDPKKIAVNVSYPSPAHADSVDRRKHVILRRVAHGRGAALTLQAGSKVGEPDLEPPRDRRGCGRCASGRRGAAGDVQAHDGECVGDGRGGVFGEGGESRRDDGGGSGMVVQGCHALEGESESGSGSGQELISDWDGHVVPSFGDYLSVTV